MNPAPFVHSALAMTRRLKRRDRCPARLALGCLEVAHTESHFPEKYKLLRCVRRRGAAIPPRKR